MFLYSYFDFLDDDDTEDEVQIPQWQNMYLCPLKPYKKFILIITFYFLSAYLIMLLIVAQ